MNTRAYASPSYQEIADFIRVTLINDWTKVLTIVHNASSEHYVLFYKGA